MFRFHLSFCFIEVINIELKLNAVGYDYKHDHDFRIERPYGSGDYLFLFFITEITIDIEGVSINGKPNSCIIFTPDHSQKYYNAKNGFINDWFHFTANNNVESFLEKLDLPTNTIFSISDFSFIRFIIKKLEREFIRKDMFWQENVSALLNNFFIELARENKYQNNYIEDPHNTALYEKFKIAREEILTNLQVPWTIEEMASLVALSRSRFSILYKDFFNQSPKEELIRARINRAKYLLVSSNSQVKDVAQKVGYDNMYHFSKQFKRMTGHAPGRYGALYKGNNQF